MSDLAIRIEELGKRYHIGSARRESDRLTERLTDAVARPFRRASGLLRGHAAATADLNAPFWALRDVSFDVSRGEAVGIVGRNGAGKSTLLKLLSRITAPTEGRITIHGRVGALLEVGTGFHRDLTGRENVFLNGAILGMRRAEVARKFDEIVAFAEMGRFIDTPVKHYSTGMYTRLAFAVAAHLEPEILVVDEVLSVGDAAFQKKCLGKMNDVAGGGRTVLFVSHNMVAVQALCGRAVWLNEGSVEQEGATPEVVAAYLRSVGTQATEREWSDAEAPGTDRVRLLRARVRPQEGPAGAVLTVDTPLFFEFEYRVEEAGPRILLNVQLFNEDGVLIFNVGASGSDEDISALGLFRDTCHVPGNLLNNGLHRIALSFSEGHRHIRRLDDILAFDLRDSDARRDGWYGKWHGAIRPALVWETEQVAVPTGRS